MKYKTEIIMIIVIFSIISILEVFTCKNTENVLKIMVNALDELKQEIINQNNDKEKIKKIEEYWNKEMKTLALYIEHDELEKVTNVISRLKGNVNNNQNGDSLENIEEIKFLLVHIKNKGVLSIQNVF